MLFYSIVVTAIRKSSKKGAIPTHIVGLSRRCAPILLPLSFLVLLTEEM